MLGTLASALVLFHAGRGHAAPGRWATGGASAMLSDPDAAAPLPTLRSETGLARPGPASALRARKGTPPLGLSGTARDAARPDAGSFASDDAEHARATSILSERRPRMHEQLRDCPNAAWT